MARGTPGKDDLAMVEPLSCDLSALSEAQRRRHSELTRFMLSRHGAVKELADGYEFEFKNDTNVFLKIAEWMVLERICCPFLSFSLELGEQNQPVRVAIRGPEGTKQIFQDVINDAHLLPEL